MAGRNDPCPCGSGKKYKQCCLVKQAEHQVERVKEERFFERKLQLTLDIRAFLAQHNGGERVFNLQKEAPFDPSLGSVQEGSGNMWAIFFRQYENGMRGIEWFLEERGRRYSGEDREMLEIWRAAKVSCYQLVDLYEQGTIMEDVWSGERFRMPYNETMRKFPLQYVTVCMIEPFFEDWCILGSATLRPAEVKATVMSRVQQLQEEAWQTSGRKLSPTEAIAGNYPEFIHLCHGIKKAGDEPVKTL